VVKEVIMKVVCDCGYDYGGDCSRDREKSMVSCLYL